MGDDIGSGVSSMAVCFDFWSTNVVQLSNKDLYFYKFWCHHPFITQLMTLDKLYWPSRLLWNTEVLSYTKMNSSILDYRQQSECGWFSYTSWLCLPPLWGPSKADDILCSKIQCYSYFYTSKVSVLVTYFSVTSVWEFCRCKSTGSIFLQKNPYFFIGL